jgi:hypothetical protein
MSEATTSELLDERAAALHLGGVAPATLRNWRSRGVGPAYVRIGGVIRYQRADLDAFVERVEPVPAP